MTTGEQLVIYSTLTTGTALEHFLNIQYGGGGIGADDATLYAEQAFMELLFLNQDLVLIGDQGGLRGSEIAGNLYVVLLTSESQEAVYGGYTRIPVVRTGTGWEYKDGSIKNIPILTWQPNEDADVDITHIGIADSLIGGNILFQKELPAPVTIATGNQAQFNYNQLTVKMY